MGHSHEELGEGGMGGDGGVGDGHECVGEGST